MRKATRGLISILLVLALTASSLAGCGKVGQKQAEEENPITATAVKYSKSGKYTTTVSSDEVDLTKATKKNVEVYYYVDDETAASDEASDEKKEQSKATVAVDEVRIDGKDCVITFTDDKAAENITDCYNILFNSVKDDAILAIIAVEFPEITLTPDIEYVPLASKDFKVTLSTEDDEFIDHIGSDDIALDSSFEKMKAEVISSSKNNLTLRLKGDIVPNEANAYQWGTINVKASAFKNSCNDGAANVNIAFIDGAFDAKTLKFADGKINVNYITYASKADELNKDNIRIDGVTVEKVDKADDKTVTLTLSADGVKSANDFAALVSDKKIEVNGQKSDIELSQASFYPVFDYIEEDGDNLNITLKLYAYNGSFDKGLKADAISFADGFADAKVGLLNMDGKKTADVVITIPANGQTAETVNVNGTVTLAAGSLVNSWGEKNAAESTNTRSYTGETLGRDVSLNEDTLLEIPKYTRGLNSTFGKICYYGGALGQVISIGKTILEATGVIQSDQAKIMEQFAAVNAKLDDIISNQYQIMDMLNEIKYTVVENANDTYKQNLADLKADVELQEDLFKQGATYMALEDAVAEGRLDKMPRLNTPDSFKKYEDYLPKVSGMTDEDLESYNNRLVDYMIDRAEQSHDTLFDDFKKSYEKMKTDLGHVAEKLARTDATNPIARYDTLCSMKYNFDSQCYGFRLSQRVTALDLLSRGMMIVFAHEKVMSYPTESTFANLQKRVEPAAKWLDDSFSTVGHPASMVKKGYNPFSYVFGKYVSLTNSRKMSSCAQFGGAIKTSSGYRNWSGDERRAFTGRILSGSIKEEFKSAGLDLNDALLLSLAYKEKKVGYNQSGRYYAYNNYTGDVIETGKKTASNAELGKVYTHNDRGPLFKPEKNKDVTFVTLY